MSIIQNFNPLPVDINTLRIIPMNGFLLTAGDMSKYNTMTVGWAQVGVLWGKICLTALVRPSRFTYEFIENSDIFSASFLPPPFAKALSICGTKSGRDIDKVDEAGLNAVAVDGTIAFRESNRVLICRKIYAHDIDVNDFLDENVAKIYESGEDIHRIYVGEILNAYQRV